MQKPNPRGDVAKTRGCCENPGICLKCAQGRKSLKGLPRATHCTDRAQTSSNVSPTVELCPPHPTFGTKVRTRRDAPKIKKKSQLYIYIYPPLAHTTLNTYTHQREFIRVGRAILSYFTRKISRPSPLIAEASPHTCGTWYRT